MQQNSSPFYLHNYVPHYSQQNFQQELNAELAVNNNFVF